MATAYSLGRQPQGFRTIRVLAPKGRQHIALRSARCRPSGAEFSFVLVSWGYRPSGTTKLRPGGPGWLPTQVSHRSGRVELPHPVPPVMVSLRDVGHAPDGGQTLRRHCRYPLVLRVRIIRIPKHSRRVLPTSP